jgi:hypothetical protein
MLSLPVQHHLLFGHLMSTGSKSGGSKSFLALQLPQNIALRA